MLLDRREVIFDSVINTNIDHFKTSAFQHHGDKVLADIVNVSLNRADDHLTDGLRPCLGQQWAQDRHTTFHSISRHEDFRHK